MLPRPFALKAAAIAAFFAIFSQLAMATMPVIPMAGMVYADWSASDYNTSVSDQSLADIAALGTTHIELLVTWYQDTVNSTYIYPSPFTPTFASLIHAIDTIHSLGMQTIMKPHVDVLTGQWRGEIKFTTEEEWATWFSNYTSYITQIATLSAKYNVSILNVGTELAGTSMRASDWIAVVNTVKTIYSGPLTYGSNHGVETDQIIWWDHLDYIGIDAYYALSSTPNPPLASLIQAWNDIIPVLAAYSDLWQRPIIFCEIGYRSTSVAAIEPWDFNGNEPADLLAQVNLYQVRFI